MKHKYTIFVFIVLLISIHIPSWSRKNNRMGGLLDWGFFAHKKINRQAVFSLPPPLIKFYKNHIAYLEREAVAPDSRRHSDKNEAPRHFIDLDNYPDSLKNKQRITWEEACVVFGSEEAIEHGIVPFHILKVYQQLVSAWRHQNKGWILRLSADLGHYIGDSNVPLHTTSNYDGQQTQQEGIHSFWETILVERYHQDYNFWVGKAEYISNKDSTIWASVFLAHSKVNKVLSLDKSLSQSMVGKDFSYIKKGNTIKKTRSDAFIKAYNNSLEGMVESAFRNSIFLVSSFWYSAWVDAGKPSVDFN